MSYVPNVTTRKPRPVGQIDETGFFEFICHEEFARRVKSREFVQWVNPSEGKFYGTPEAPLRQAAAEGRDLVFDYTPQLFINMKRQQIATTIGIFLIPPSLADLKDRLQKRGTEDEENQQIKFKMGLQDLAYVREHDYYLVNDDFETTLDSLKSIRQAEKLRIDRHEAGVSTCLDNADHTMLFYYDVYGSRLKGVSGAYDSGIDAT